MPPIYLCKSFYSTISLGKVVMKHSSLQFGDQFSGFGHQSEKFSLIQAPVLSAISRPDVGHALHFIDASVQIV